MYFLIIDFASNCGAGTGPPISCTVVPLVYGFCNPTLIGRGGGAVAGPMRETFLKSDHSPRGLRNSKSAGRTRGDWKQIHWQVEVVDFPFPLTCLSSRGKRQVRGRLHSSRCGHSLVNLGASKEDVEVHPQVTPTAGPWDGHLVDLPQDYRRVDECRIGFPLYAKVIIRSSPAANKTPTHTCSLTPKATPSARI